MPEKLAASEKKLIWTAHAFFVVFLFLAAFLYRERVMVADCAFQVFHLIRTGSFAIYHNRFSPFLSQLLPLAAIHARLPLNVVLVLYSVSVPLMMYLYYNLAAHVLKDYRAAVAMALAACMVLTQGFYFAVFELNQSVILLILLFALLQFSGRLRLWHWLLLLAGTVLALFFHPLIIIGFLYLMGYGFLKAENKKKWPFILLAGFALLVLLAKSKFLADPYDSDKMTLFTDPNNPDKFSVKPALELLSRFFTLEVTGNFLKWLVRDYYLVLIFSGLISWQYLRSRNWLLLAYYWLALPAYIVLLLLVYPTGNNTIRYYLESHYQLIALIVAVPLTYDVLPNWKNYRFLPLALLLILGIRLVTIYQYREVFTERLAWYDKLYDYTDQFPETRFLINEKNLPYLTRQNQLTWASAHESLLYFASQHKKPIKTFLIFENPEQFGYLKPETEKFITAFDIYADSDLPAHYFPLVPSQYRWLNSAPDSTVLKAITVAPAQQKLTVKKGQGIFPVPVQINSSKLLPSGLNGGQPYMLGYHIYRNGQEIAAHTFRTPLEVDVQGSYRQNLLVEIPEEAGVYHLVPVLLPQDLNTWQPDHQLELIVE